MLFDGLHALISGNFVTPKNGTHADRLGPRAVLLSAGALDPWSMLVKVTFAGYASAYPAAGIAFAARAQGAWWAALNLAVLGLWFPPFGTVADLAVVALVLAPALRSPSWTDSKKVCKAPRTSHRGACFADLLPALQRADFTTSVHER